MKLIIPPECQLGAHKYSIVWWNEKVQHSADAVAQGSARDQVIRLDRRWSDTWRFEHLVHEIRHQIDYLLSDEDHTETHVRAESSLLCQSLLSLGIEPDFSQIQEEKF